jgi:hypothetical protein
LPKDESETEATACHIKLRVKLEQDDSGWPPVESEGIWAIKLENGNYQIDNIPWFAKNLAVDDEVIAHPDSDGVLWYVEKSNWAGHFTIRLIPLIDDTWTEKIALVRNTFVASGITVEGLSQYGILALDIEPGVDLPRLKLQLTDGENKGLWSYEEGCISDEWAAI